MFFLPFFFCFFFFFVTGSGGPTPFAVAWTTPFSSSTLLSTTRYRNQRRPELRYDFLAVGGRNQHRHRTWTSQSQTSTLYNNRGRSVTPSVSVSLQSSTDDNDSSSSSSSTTTTSSNTTTTNKLDTILSQLTNAFPLFVLSFAIGGMIRPSLLQWVNQGSLISIMLASVMCGTGLTLEQKDFTNVMQDDWSAIPLGVLCQYLIMPLAAFVIGRNLLLSSSSSSSSLASMIGLGGISQVHGPALFLGLLLVGCSPGGTASNLVSLIAQANVALSVLLTSVSTIMAAGVTPLLVRFFMGIVKGTSSATTTTAAAGGAATTTAVPISVSGWTLCLATAKVVLLPVLFGMWVNARAPNLSQRVSRFTPFASVLLVSLICGGVVAQNATLLLSHLNLLFPIMVSVVLLHSIGFGLGYWIPKRFFGKSEQTARTMAIETGMQNSALAVVLARSIPSAGPLACVPGALSATAHSCLGSLLAAYWRYQDNNTRRRNRQKEDETEEEERNQIVSERTYTGDDDFDPAMMI